MATDMNFYVLLDQIKESNDVKKKSTKKYNKSKLNDTADILKMREKIEDKEYLNNAINGIADRLSSDIVNQIYGM
jgi:hypothetical protein